MKKLFTLLLVVITAFILTIGASAKTVLKGDLNIDGKITAADARSTLRIAAKLDTADDTKMLIADVTNDKKITASDARSILRAAAKLDEAFGEIEIDSNTETETTTVQNTESTTVSGPKTEVSSIIGKNSDSIIKEFDGMHKVGTSDGTSKYTNGKVTVVSDPAIIKDNKISSIIVYDSAYLLNGVSVDMTPAKATDTLKKADWIVNSQDSDEICLSKNLMKIVINVSDGKITSIEYIFAESLLSPDETTTVPVTENTTINPENPGEHKHNYSSEIIAPGCTEKGFTKFTCSCGDTYTTNETEPAGHDYVSVEVNPSCTENGFTKHTCSKCSDMYISDTVAAKGHDAVWVTVTKPEPGKDGLDQYKCRTCLAVLNESIVPAPDVPGTEEPTTKDPVNEEPTTTKPDTDEPTTGHVHTYTSVTVVPPTCEDNGYTRFICSVCFETYDTDIVPSTGHNAFWEITTPAEIGKEGLKEYKCRYCDTVLEKEIIPALKEEEQEKPEGELTVEDLPVQIKAFMNGNFGIEGYNYSGKDKSPISMYISPDHVKAGMNLEGMSIDLLIRDVKSKNSKVYLIRPDIKKYAKLTSVDMGILGIKTEDLKLDFSNGITTPDSIIYSTQTIGGTKYDIYTLYSGAEYCKIYMIGEDIKRIETFETETKMLKTRIDVTTFIAEPSEDSFSVSGYKNALTYMALFF